MIRETPTTVAQRQGRHVTPRYRRLIRALLTGPLHREDADRVTGASNSPHYIRQLKGKFGLSIITDRVEEIDRDGQKTRPGVYTLEADSIELAEQLLSQETNHNSAK